MRSPAPLALCLLLLLAALPVAGALGQSASQPARQPAAQPTGKATGQGHAQAARPAKPASKPTARLLAKPAPGPVSRQDLLSPYSSMQRGLMGPPRELAGEQQPEGESVQSNATSWKLDPSLTPRSKDDDSPVRFQFGKEKVVDPITGKELTGKSDPAGAANRLKDLDVKGAADKLGGKAGVNVDVLKF